METPGSALRKENGPTIIECVLLRFRGRRAVGTIIAGLVILSLVLTVLSTMVFVSQQYDYYQQVAKKMAQYHQQRALENLVGNYPGLVLWTTSPPSGSWGSGCVTTYNCYNLTLSNLGGVGVQITKIYITSQGSSSSTSQGCYYTASIPNPSLCVLNPSASSTPYAFQQSTQFLNPGETNHVVLLYLPTTVILPNGAPGQNTIIVATSRGNEFSFQWPFQIEILGGQTTSAFSAGIMKVAYQCNPSICSNPGYDSKNEPGVSGGSASGQYCHTESTSATVDSEWPQEFTGITVGGKSIGDGGDLWFVNPWITATIFCNTANDCTGSGSSCSSSCNDTTLYLYVNITNTGTTAYTPSAGSLDLTWSGSNHIDGVLLGMWYNNAFWADGASGAPQVPCATYSTCVSSSPSSHPDFFYGIFRATAVTLNTGGGGNWPPTYSIMFWGALSLSNSLENTQFVGGTELSTGLWIRYSCSSSS